VPRQTHLQAADHPAEGKQQAGANPVMHLVLDPEACPSCQKQPCCQGQGWARKEAQRHQSEDILGELEGSAEPMVQPLDQALQEVRPRRFQQGLDHLRTQAWA
jgi:hypothetical protein